MSTTAVTTTFNFCTKTRAFFSNRAVIATESLVASLAAQLIPVPFLRGALTGGFFYQAVHNVWQHRDGPIMQGNLKSVATSRTWKHVSAGTAVMAVGYSLAIEALRSSNPKIRACFTACVLVSTYLAYKVSYSDWIWEGDKNRMEEPLSLQAPANRV